MAESSSLINEWYVKARQDIATVRHMQTYHPIPIEIVCYHCQQAGEKILKGMLTNKEIKVPYTHQLDILLNLLDDRRMDGIQDACDILTQFATTTRYPSPIELNIDHMDMAVLSLNMIIEHASSIGLPVE